MGRARRRWILVSVASGAVLACVLLLPRQEPHRRAQHGPSSVRGAVGSAANPARDDPNAPGPFDPRLDGPASSRSVEEHRLRGNVWIWSGWRESGQPEPLAGIDVVAEPAGVDSSVGAVRAVTGPRGAFELVLGPGDWRVALRPRLGFAVRVDEGVPSLRHDAWPAPAKDAQKELWIVVDAAGISSPELGRGAGAEPVQLLVRAASVLGGRVVEDESGAPVPGARVTLGADERGGGHLPTVTDALGRFWLVSETREALTSLGRDRLVVQARGWAPGALAMNLGYSFPPSESMTGLEVRLRRPLRLEGRAIGPDGQGLAGVQIELRGRLGDADAAPDEVAALFDPLSWSWLTETDAQGAFAIDGLAPSVSPQHTELRLIARAEGWIQLDAFDVQAGPGAQSVTVRLAPEAVVTGQLVDVAGVPVAGWISRPVGWDRARFVIGDTDPLTVADRVSSELTGLQELAARGRAPRLWLRRARGRGAFTGADGRFRLEGLAPGAHEVVVHAPGHAERTLQVEAPLDLGRVVLARARALRGRVVDPGGIPVPGALVRALRVREGRPPPSALTWPDPHHADPAEERGAGLTDGRGEFEIDGLGDEPVDLVVFSDADRALRAAVRPGRGPVEVTLAPAPAIEVLLQARDASDGRELAVELEADSEDGTWLPVRRTAGGGWQVTGAGPVALIVDHEDYARFVRWVDADAAGRRVDLGPVSLTRGGGRLHVRAHPPPRPLASYAVEVVQLGIGRVASERLPRERATSSWTSPLLEPGAYEVRMTEVGWDGDVRRSVREVRVRPGEQLEVDFSD